MSERTHTYSDTNFIGLTYQRDIKQKSILNLDEAEILKKRGGTGTAKA